MSEEVVQRWDGFNAAIARRVATGTRGLLPQLTEQARGVHREVIKWTPPGHAGVQGGTRAALLHGQAKVAGDIGKLYGSANEAYDAIAERNPSAARAFWALKTRDHNAARDIVQEQLHTSLITWDEGALHKRNFKNGRVRGNKSKPLVYVTNSKALKAFVKEQQSHVMYLTAGWREIMSKLGLSLPGFIDHDAPSAAMIEITETRLRIVASNEVPYGLATDLQRRVQFAIDQQTANMQRQWEDYIEKLNRKAGL